MNCQIARKRRRFHGMLSLILLDTANLVALIAMFISSLAGGMFFLVLYLAGAALIVYAWCGKCQCPEDCAHLLPGRLMTVWPRRRQGPYTGTDLLGVALPLTILVIYPQTALMALGWAFYLYWSLVAVGVAEIILFVCPGCRNGRCLVHGRRRSSGGTTGGNN